jgi:hypothetical protein
MVAKAVSGQPYRRVFPADGIRGILSIDGGTDSKGIEFLQSATLGAAHHVTL